MAQDLEKQEEQGEEKSRPCNSLAVGFECCVYVGQADSGGVRGTEI